MYSGETDGDLEWIKKIHDGYRAESEHRRLDYRNFTDDEEVTLLPHKRDTNVPDNPVSDVRDGPDTSDTQREDWLLQTEPLHGARPRQNERERPPDRAGAFNLEAAGGGGGGRPEGGSTWNPGLSAVARVADLTGRGSDYTTEGGAVRLPRLRCRQEGRKPCLRFVQMSVHEMVVQTYRMLDRRYMCWLTRLLGCNRT